jgi:hypothetical protein
MLSNFDFDRDRSTSRRATRVVTHTGGPFKKTPFNMAFNLMWYIKLCDTLNHYFKSLHTALMCYILIMSYNH